ncbi:MAG: hypothetical protein AAF623_17405 [Planctomycetota bacterium]
MSDQSGLTPELESLETSLRNAALKPVSFSKEELMYRAGYAAALADRSSVAATQFSVRASEKMARSWFWQVLALTSTSAAIVLASLLNFHSIGSMAKENLANKKPDPNSVVSESIQSHSVVKSNRPLPLPSVDPVQLLERLDRGQQLSSGPITQGRISYVSLESLSGMDRSVIQSPTAHSSFELRNRLLPELGL